MKVSREEVLHIARLARIALNLLDNFEILQQVNTDDVPPTAQSVALQSVMRDDKVAPSFPPEDILANAPRRDEDCFRVKPVLE